MGLSTNDVIKIEIDTKYQSDDRVFNDKGEEKFQPTVLDNFNAISDMASSLPVKNNPIGQGVGMAENIISTGQGISSAIQSASSGVSAIPLIGWIYTAVRLAIKIAQEAIDATKKEKQSDIMQKRAYGEDR